MGQPDREYAGRLPLHQVLLALRQRRDAKDYPHILATLPVLTDPRVTYWEPAKWIARLRALKTDENLTLLKTNMAAGHGGASGRFDRLKEVALAYAFALMVTGKS